VTGRARSSIRRTIRSSEREEFHKLGRSTLEQTLSRAGKKLSDLALAPVLETLSIESEEALFEAIGRGQVQAIKVVEMLFPALKGQVKVAHDRRRIEESEAQLYVRGSGLTPGISIHFGHCCSPLPGDRIVGILEPEKGLTVHTIDCGRLVEFSDDDSLWQDLQWTPRAETNATAASRLKATIRNAPGVLGQVATQIGEAGGNILNLVMTHRQQDFFDVEIDVEVRDARHATTLMAALRANAFVDSVERVRG
jgi:GTP diphosphokinase / guanosine-3',5'-bis(diphosphate) 3'-diphosphatase